MAAAGLAIVFVVGFPFGLATRLFIRFAIAALIAFWDALFRFLSALNPVPAFTNAFTAGCLGEGDVFSDSNHSYHSSSSFSSSYRRHECEYTTGAGRVCQPIRPITSRNTKSPATKARPGLSLSRSYLTSSIVSRRFDIWTFSFSYLSTGNVPRLHRVP